MSYIMTQEKSEKIDINHSEVVKLQSEDQVAVYQIEIQPKYNRLFLQISWPDEAIKAKVFLSGEKGVETSVSWWFKEDSEVEDSWRKLDIEIPEDSENSFYVSFQDIRTRYSWTGIPGSIARFKDQIEYGFVLEEIAREGDAISVEFDAGNDISPDGSWASLIKRYVKAAWIDENLYRDNPNYQAAIGVQTADGERILLPYVLPRTIFSEGFTGRVSKAFKVPEWLKIIVQPEIKRILQSVNTQLRQRLLQSLVQADTNVDDVGHYADYADKALVNLLMSEVEVSEQGIVVGDYNLLGREALANRLGVLVKEISQQREIMSKLAAYVREVNKNMRLD
jgi:hypothetical protein